MFSVHPALPPCLGLTTRRGTQGDITGGMECRRAPQDGQVPPTTSRRRPCAGARVPAPMCRLQLPVCAWGAEAFMTSVAHLPGTTRAGAAQALSLLSPLPSIRPFPAQGGVHLGH